MSEAQKKQQHAKKQQKKGKGRAQITARSPESRTKRARHRKSSNNTRRTTAVTAKASKDECGELICIVPFGGSYSEPKGTSS